jgi:hypothetical protein
VTLKELKDSLELWEERESRFYGNWRDYVEKGSTSPRRAFWYAEYKHARYMVSRRRQEIRKREPDKPQRPRFLYSHHPPRGHYVNNRLMLTGSVERGSGHYSAGDVDKSDTDAQRLNDIYARYHDGKWGDQLEYHVNITRKGSIVFNRPPKLMGYGVGGHNTGTLHVLMHGTTGDTPSPAQQAAFNWLLDHWHTDQVPAKYRAPRDMRNVPWYGHNSFSGPGGQTACPGKFKTLYESKGARR